MIVNIKEFFKIANKNLFVIVVNADYDSLIDAKIIFDKQRKKSFPIFSIEWVNLSNLSMPGITLKYETHEDLALLEALMNDFAIVE